MRAKPVRAPRLVPVLAMALCVLGTADALAQSSPLDLLREFARPLPDLPSLLQPRSSKTRTTPARTAPARAAPAMPKTLTVLPRLRPDMEADVAAPLPLSAPVPDMASASAVPADDGSTGPGDDLFSTATIAPPGRFRMDSADTPGLAFAPLDDLPVPRFRPDMPDISDVSDVDRPAASGDLDPATPEEAARQVAGSAAVIARLVPLPRVRPPHTPAVRVSAVPGEAKSAADPGCAADLIALGVVADRIDPIRSGACGIDAPYRVTAFAGGGVTLTQPATLTCAAARETARWLRDHVRPAARTHLGGDVTGLRVAASYACRTRNSQPGARLSEHALGRAIDVAAIQVEGAGWLVVGSETGTRQRVLLASRRAACGPFKTVLGPGSDAFHDDHFHLDLAQRRRGSVYCKGMPDH